MPQQMQTPIQNFLQLFDATEKFYFVTACVLHLYFPIIAARVLLQSFLSTAQPSINRTKTLMDLLRLVA